MTDYSQTTDFSAKDSLPTGNSAKRILGSEVDTELSNISTAIASKVDEPGSPSDGDELVYRSSAWTNDVLIPIGAMIEFAGSAEPTNWLFCDGRAISRSTYSALFAAIGTTYGVGDGSTTFNLPDARFRVGVAPDDMGTAEGAASRDSGTTYASGSGAIGSEGGADSKTLAEANLPSHTHGASAGTVAWGNGSSSPDDNNDGASVTVVGGASIQTFSYAAFGQASPDAVEINQPFYVANKIIRYQ